MDQNPFALFSGSEVGDALLAEPPEAGPKTSGGSAADSCRLFAGHGAQRCGPSASVARSFAPVMSEHAHTHRHFPFWSA